MYDIQINDLSRRVARHLKLEFSEIRPIYADLLRNANPFTKGSEIKFVSASHPDVEIKFRVRDKVRDFVNYFTVGMCVNEWSKDPFTEKEAEVQNYMYQALGVKESDCSAIYTGNLIQAIADIDFASERLHGESTSPEIKEHINMGARLYYQVGKLIVVIDVKTESAAL